MEFSMKWHKGTIEISSALCGSCLMFIGYYKSKVGVFVSLYGCVCVLVCLYIFLFISVFIFMFLFLDIFMGMYLFIAVYLKMFINVLSIAYMLGPHEVAPCETNQLCDQNP